MLYVFCTGGALVEMGDGMKVIRVVGVACAIALLAACGGGSDSDQSADVADTLGQTETEIEATGNDCEDAAAAQRVGEYFVSECVGG